MSTSYPYAISVTANNAVNPDILAQELLDAGLASGGVFEGVSIDGGKIAPGGVIEAPGTIIVQWQNALDPADEAAQDAAVAAHQGEAFGKPVQRKSSEPVSSTPLGTPQSKVSATADPLPAGDYLLSAYCEIRTPVVVANSGVRARVVLDGNEVAQTNAGLADQWQSFSAEGIVTLKAGAKPMLQITYQRIGAPNDVEIQRARIAIAQQAP
jgi:hypothetical protein